MGKLFITGGECAPGAGLREKVSPCAIFQLAKQFGYRRVGKKELGNICLWWFVLFAASAPAAALCGKGKGAGMGAPTKGLPEGGMKQEACAASLGTLVLLGSILQGWGSADALGRALMCLGGVPPPLWVPVLGAAAVQRFLLRLGEIPSEAGAQQGSGARKLQMPFLGNPGD